MHYDGCGFRYFAHYSESVMFKKASFGRSFIFISLGLGLLSYSVQSLGNISISSRRINVDYLQGTTNFTVTSRQNTAQQCNITLTHNSFDEAGYMTHYTGKELPPYAADELVRYSPKEFELLGNQKQTIRFTFRRKPNIPAMEHRAYVVLVCQDKERKQPKLSGSESASISIQPILKHSIPLIVRPQKLDVEASFDNIRLENQFLFFDFNRKGNRSVYGSVEVINRENNEILTKSASLVMYTETTTKSFNMKLPVAIKLEQLVLHFKEDVNFGGDLEVTWPNGVVL